MTITSFARQLGPADKSVFLRLSKLSIHLRDEIERVLDDRLHDNSLAWLVAAAGEITAELEAVETNYNRKD